MSDYRTVLTSPEVWAVIRTRHPELRVFGAHTSIGSVAGEVFTSYGFEGHDFPMIEARTIWEIDPEKPHERLNERHQLWLCSGIEED